MNKVINYRLIHRAFIPLVCLGWHTLASSSLSGQGPPGANIMVRPSISEGEISPFIYGLSVEWLDDGNGILSPNTGMPRPEVMDLLKPLRVPVWRFPGGILSDYYHWQDRDWPEGVAADPDESHGRDTAR